jgi:hypothetical protein
VAWNGRIFYPQITQIVIVQFMVFMVVPRFDVYRITGLDRITGLAAG